MSTDQGGPGEPFDSAYDADGAGVPPDEYEQVGEWDYQPGEWDYQAGGWDGQAEPWEPGDDAGGGALPGGGPWDAGDPYPESDRADFGSLLVPIMPMQEIEVATDGERLVWVTVKSGASELRVHAFAAPRSRGLWADVREEITSELAAGGATAQEAEGPFGPELFAYVPVEPGAPASGTMPVRFVGVDGPRWLLRGLIIGPAATGDEPAGPFEDVIGDTVVVRGDHPMPPRDLLELRLPPEVQQAIEEQAATQQQAGEEPGSRFRPDLNPFERGPEFTETR